MRGAAAALAAAWLLAAPPSALAHRLDAALSVIEINPRTGAMEIEHRLFAHDLEHVLDLGAVGARFFETAAGQEQLRVYVTARFRLEDASGRAIALRFVGAELDGDLVRVYFEGRRPSGRSIIVDSDLLQDLSERQTNQVNIRLDGRTRTALFPPGQGPVRVALERSR